MGECLLEDMGFLFGVSKMLQNWDGYTTPNILKTITLYKLNGWRSQVCSINYISTQYIPNKNQKASRPTNPSLKLRALQCLLWALDEGEE